MLHILTCIHVCKFSNILTHIQTFVYNYALHTNAFLYKFIHYTYIILYIRTCDTAQAGIQKIVFTYY